GELGCPGYDEVGPPLEGQRLQVREYPRCGVRPEDLAEQDVRPLSNGKSIERWELAPDFGRAREVGRTCRHGGDAGPLHVADAIGWSRPQHVVSAGDHRPRQRNGWMDVSKPRWGR